MLFAAEGDTISIIKDCSLYKHPWDDSPEQKQSVSLLASCAEIQETNGEFLPTC